MAQTDPARVPKPSRSGYRYPDRAIIIGAGIGGLSMAILLAGLGVRVSVIEKNAHPGGLTRSYQRKGISCDVGVHYLGSLDRGQILKKFFDFLGVTSAIKVSRMGECGIVDRYIFTSAQRREFSFDLPCGFDAFEDRLHRACPGDLSVISSLMEDIRRAAKRLHNLDLLYNDSNDWSLLDQAEPMGEILDRAACSPELRSILAMPANWMGVPLQDCPAYYHNMALASYISSSYRLQGHGADMVDAFVHRLDELGGEIIASQSVTELLIKDRVVEGVRLSSGERHAADLVIAAVHPQIVLAMLPEGAVKPSYRQRISNLVNTHGIFSACATIDSNKHPELPYNLFKVATDRQGEVADLRYYQIRRTGVAGKNLFSLLTSGHDALWQPWQNTTTGNRGQAYRKAKNQLAMRLFTEAEEVFGRLSGLELIDAYTPLTLRDWVNTPGGSAYGVQRSVSQLLATAMLNRTAVKGLYLAGQNVMAPGIIGTIMGSFSTLKLILGPERFRKQIQL